MITIQSEPLPGIFILNTIKFQDLRGNFFKIYNQDNFKKIGIKFNPKEYFFSSSKLNVIRGMHFQNGEFAHDKLVFCSYGKILDVIVDVRINSKYFNKPYSIELEGDPLKAIYISKGYAHGFLSLSNPSIVHYFTNKEYNPEADKGVLWDSINFRWPIAKPLISERDEKHLNIDDIKCEFF